MYPCLFLIMQSASACIYIFFLIFFFNSTWTNLIILFLISTRKNTNRRDRFGNFLGRPLLSSDFFLRIATSNFRDLKNVMPVVFGMVKIFVSGTQKGRL